MTGRYPFHTGLQHTTTITPGSTAKIPTDIPTAAEVFRKAGYHTLAVGKWHLGYSKWDYTPTGRGFDSYTGYMQGETDYYNKTVRIGGYDFWQNRTFFAAAVGDIRTKTKYSMEQYMSAATDFLDVHSGSDKPLFIYFAHQDNHSPLELPPGDSFGPACDKVRRESTENRYTLCAMTSVLDKAVGDFVAMLKSEKYGNMWEDTLLWVATDNGGMPQFQEGTPASAASNYPLRGGKTTLYEGGVRGVSFVAGGTNVLPATAAGTVVTDLMHAADMLPTVAAIAGVSLIDNTMNVDTSGNADADGDADAVAGMDGISMADVFLKGAKGKRMEVPINILDNCDLCHGQKKSLGPKGNFNFSALIMLDTDIATGKNTLWKLISGHVGGYDGWWSNGDYTHEAANTTYPNAYQLFNLSEDEVERVDLATTHPDVANKLLARLKVLGDATQGYKPPQYNIPSKEGKPEYHNGTWAPFQS